MSETPIVKIYKADASIPTPKYQTHGAACFDLHAYMPVGEKIKVFTKDAEPRLLEPSWDSQRNLPYMTLFPGERALLRTGLIFDIPSDYSIRMYARSSMAWKYGLVVAQGEGVIDEDFTDETHIIIANISVSSAKIYGTERIAQAELVRYEQCEFQELSDLPPRKGNRVGGLGSTGRT